MLAGTIVINIMIAIADITALIRIIAMALIFIIAIIMIIAMIDMAYTVFFHYITCCLILQKSLLNDYMSSHPLLKSNRRATLGLPCGKKHTHSSCPFWGMVHMCNCIFSNYCLFCNPSKTPYRLDMTIYI